MYTISIKPLPDVQVSIGDGSFSRTEQSVFEINLSRGEDPDAVVHLPTIVSVEPNQISSEGHDTLSLFGTSFDAFPDPTATVYVQFGSSKPVVGSVVGSTQIICTAPPTTSSSSYADVVQGYFVLVRVTNLVDFWSNAVQLFVETPPDVISVFPDVGPSCGGTSVSIVGRNFLPSASLVCVFGDGADTAWTTASWRSPDLLECISPSWVLPDGLNGIVVPFTVSTRREQDQYPLLSFRFVPPVVIGSISPETGPAESWTNVTITGAHLRGYDLSCIIDGQAVLPTVQQDDYLQCTVPPRGIPPDRTFKIKVAASVDSPDIDPSYRYELVDADVTTSSKAFDSVSQAQVTLEPGAIVLPLVRGHQYWLDQSDASNFGLPIAFSSDSRGIHASGGKSWTKGVQRLSLSAGTPVNSTVGIDGTGADIVSFLVPADAPDILHTYSETSPGLEGGIIAVITDQVERSFVGVVATHGSACDPPVHPFRYGQFEYSQYGTHSTMQTK